MNTGKKRNKKIGELKSIMAQIISDESLICRNDYSYIIGRVVLQIKFDGDKSNWIKINFQLGMKRSLIQLKKAGTTYYSRPCKCSSVVWRS